MTYIRLANAAALSGVLAVLLLSLFFQFLFNELPCPLCFLQRIGFIGMALGFLLNLQFGFYPSHYAIIILNSVMTSLFALRQIAKNALVGGYSSVILGYHFYTWAFIIAMTAVVGTTLLFSIDKQYTNNEKKYGRNWRLYMRTVVAVICAIVILNIYTVSIECGFQECPRHSQSNLAQTRSLSQDLGPTLEPH